MPSSRVILALSQAIFPPIFISANLFPSFPLLILLFLTMRNIDNSCLCNNSHLVIISIDEICRIDSSSRAKSGQNLKATALYRTLNNSTVHFRVLRMATKKFSPGLNNNRFRSTIDPTVCQTCGGGQKSLTRRCLKAHSPAFARYRFIIFGYLGTSHGDLGNPIFCCPNDARRKWLNICIS